DDGRRLSPPESIYAGVASCAEAALLQRSGDLLGAEAAAVVAVANFAQTPALLPLIGARRISIALADGRIDDAVALATIALRLIQSLGGTGGTELSLRVAAVAAFRAAGDEAAANAAAAEAARQLELRQGTLPDPAARDRLAAFYREPS